METISSGPFVMRSTCRMCHGTRFYVKHPCGECGGKGSTTQRKLVSVPVPAGVEDGQTLRMQAANKELFITFKVAKSDYFRRDGADVHTDAEVSLSQALLGGTIIVQGLFEDVTLRIPPGTSSHTRMRITGKGMKRINSYGQGDHYVHLKIRIPLYEYSNFFDFSQVTFIPFFSENYHQNKERWHLYLQNTKMIRRGQ